MNIQQHIRLLSAALLLLGLTTSHAANIEWADSTGNTTWTTNSALNGTATSASWVGDNAPVNNITTDNAIFTSVSNAQPNLTVQTRIRGIEFQMASGGLAMTGGNNVFSIGAGGINATEQISGTNTITNARIGLLGANQTWTYFSTADTAGTSTFTFDSTVDLGSRNLIVVGQRNAAAGNVGIINFDRAIAGTASLTINSSNTNNTVNLNAANTYTGATSVTGGRLMVNGSLAAGSAVTVGEFGTLGGTGTIGGTLSFHADSGFHIANINNALTVDGTVTFGTGFGIANLSGIDWDSLNLNTGYTLISTDQTFSAANIANFGIGNAANVGTGRQAYFQTGSLQLVVIPEPSTLILLGISLASLAVFRRRRA